MKHISIGSLSFSNCLDNADNEMEFKYSKIDEKLEIELEYVDNTAEKCGDKIDTAVIKELKKLQNTNNFVQ